MAEADDAARRLARRLGLRHVSDGEPGLRRRRNGSRAFRCGGLVGDEAAFRQFLRREGNPGRAPRRPGPTNRRLHT